MFRGLNLIRHCNTQTVPKLPTLKLTKRCNAQKNFKKSQTFVDSAPGLAIDAKILELLELFEHYSASRA